MVEVVARAIYFRGDDQGDAAWKHAQPGRRSVAIEQARAAIEAMMESSIAMVRAGEEEITYAADDIIKNRAEPVWQSMITAALKEG
jgi:hypothetical protein